MTDANDELERLARADPIDQAALPSANDQRARALFEEITMSESAVQSPRPHPRRAAWAIGAAAALILIVGAVVAVRAGDEPTPRTPDGSGDVASPAISPGGSTGSCVELYDADTLARREVAFDGTVAAVDGDNVTFDVKSAFKGVTANTVTLKGASTLGGGVVSSAGAGISLTPGTRLLVAGDGGFAWSCGFTQPYDPAVAEQWGQAFKP